MPVFNLEKLQSVKNQDADFDRIFKNTAGAEDGYVVDHAGPTNLGITQSTLNAFNKKYNLPPESVKNITYNKAKEIAYKEFYKKPKINQLPNELKDLAFDYGFNAGPSKAIRGIQTIVGAKQDGILGKETFKKINEWIKIRGKKDFLSDYINERQQHNNRLIREKPATYEQYKEGWKNRLQEIKNRFDLSALNPFSTQNAIALPVFDANRLSNTKLPKFDINKLSNTKLPAQTKPKDSFAQSMFQTAFPAAGQIPLKEFFGVVKAGAKKGLDLYTRIETYPRRKLSKTLDDKELITFSDIPETRLEKILKRTPFGIISPKLFPFSKIGEFEGKLQSMFIRELADYATSPTVWALNTIPTLKFKALQRYNKIQGTKLNIFKDELTDNLVAAGVERGQAQKFADIETYKAWTNAKPLKKTPFEINKSIDVLRRNKNKIIQNIKNIIINTSTTPPTTTKPVFLAPEPTPAAKITPIQPITTFRPKMPAEVKLEPKIKQPIEDIKKEIESVTDWKTYLDKWRKINKAAFRDISSAEERTAVLKPLWEKRDLYKPAKPETVKTKPETVKTEPEIKEPAKKSDPRLAIKIRKVANVMQKQINSKLNPAISQQNLTARRARIADSMQEDGEKLAKIQSVLYGIADAIEQNTLPKELTGVTTKAQVEYILTNKKVPELSVWGLLDIIKKLKGKKGIVDLREKLGYVFSGYQQYREVLKESQIPVVKEILKIAEKSGQNKWTISQIKSDIARYERIKKAGIKGQYQYDKVKELLQNIGNQAPVIDEKTKAIKKAEQNLIGAKIQGFFPTPKTTGNKLVELADIQPNDIILEPSAGKGDLAEVIQAQHPKNKIDVVEKMISLQNLLKLKDFNVTGDDFLQITKKYDKIIMNPPFEKLQDIDHVKHAYSLLNPNGKVVSIMSEAPFYRSDAKAVEFREWLDSVGGYSEKLEAGLFKGKESFRQTGVNTRVVVIDKAGVEMKQPEMKQPEMKQPEMKQPEIKPPQTKKTKKAKIIKTVVKIVPDDVLIIKEMQQDIATGEAGRRVPTENGEWLGIASTFPDYFKNKGYSKKNVLMIIDKVLTGQPITEKQQEIFDDLFDGIKQSLEEQKSFYDDEYENFLQEEKNAVDPIPEAENRKEEEIIAQEINSFSDERLIDETIGKGKLGDTSFDVEKFDSEYIEKNSESGYNEVREEESNYYEKIQNSKGNVRIIAARARGEISNSPLKVKYKKQGYFVFPKEKISSPADVAFAFQQLKNEAVERFYVIAVKNNIPIAIEPLHIGTIASAPADTFETFHILKAKDADSFYLAHNHPSGDPQPSRADIDLSKKHQDAFQKHNIKFKGHIVINDTKFGFINPWGNTHILSHTEPVKIKQVPVYTKYIEWYTQKEALTALKSPAELFELIKGVNTDWEHNSAIIYLNNQLRITGVEIVPAKNINQENIVIMASGLRSKNVIIANIKIDEREIIDIKNNLDTAFGIRLLDVVKFKSPKNYISYSDEGRLFEEGAKYSGKKKLFEESARYSTNEWKTLIARTEKRNQMIKAVKDYFKLTPKEFYRILGNRDMGLMSEREFSGFLEGLENQAALLAERRQLIHQLKFTIFVNELTKVDNLRKVMHLPTIKNMSNSQLINFDNILNQYQIGDEFLSVRKLEMVDRTDLKGAKTIREAREKLAKKINIPVENLTRIKVTELDKYRYDTALAEKNVFYKMMIDEVNKAFLNAEARFLQVETKVNKLVSLARKSKKRNIVDVLIPTDKLIFKYLESDNAGKLKLAQNMTPAEIKAAKYIRGKYAEMRDYLIQFEVLKRYISNYTVHIRRGFLETWRSDNLLKAFKEIFTKYRFEEAKFNILDGQTGEILPLEKFFQYSMHRTGALKPTQNIAKAFTSYLQAFEKKCALDSIVPELDIYAYVLTPKVKTPRGLDFDRSFKKFIREWINTKKGRTAGIVGIKQGGKIDTALRAGKMFTVLHDLALNIPVGLASRYGETSMNYIMLGSKKQTLGNIRKLSKKGKRILAKYQNFTGKTAWDSLSEASKDIGDKFMEGMFFLFRNASTSANQTFLLGSLSPLEWKTETVSIKRLTDLKREMGRYRVVQGSESIVGKTSVGKLWTQYKTWAIPPLRTTIKNINDISVALKTKQIKQTSRQFAELFRSMIVIAVVGLVGGAITRDKNDKSFTGLLLKKAYRDAMSIIGAFDPTIYSGVRLLNFLEDLTKSIKQIVRLETYKTKDGLKGIGTLKRTLIPQAIKQFKFPQKKKEKEKKYSWQE